MHASIIRNVFQRRAGPNNSHHRISHIWILRRVREAYKASKESAFHPSLLANFWDYTPIYHHHLPNLSWYTIPAYWASWPYFPSLNLKHLTRTILNLTASWFANQQESHHNLMFDAFSLDSLSLLSMAGGVGSISAAMFQGRLSSSIWLFILLKIQLYSSYNHCYYFWPFH